MSHITVDCDFSLTTFVVYVACMSSTIHYHHGEYSTMQKKYQITFQCLSVFLLKLVQAHVTIFHAYRFKHDHSES